MKECLINKQIIENKNLFSQYIESVIVRETTDCNSLQDNKNAFYYLLTKVNLNEELTTKVIIETANRVNRSSKYIANGLRKSGNHIFGTDIKTPSAKELPNVIETLVINYNMNILEDIFLNEAMLHIGIITSQLFEDGNHRTANLITNYNLIKQNIAPIIIPKEKKEEYDRLVYSKDIDHLAIFFKELVIKENKFINNTMARNEFRNTKHY